MMPTKLNFFNLFFLLGLLRVGLVVSKLEDEFLKMDYGYPL